jgi:penicillin-binding protein 2
MQEALRDSCNVYFFRLALAAGPEAVQRAAEAVGLGRRTGIDLDYEVPGLVPTDAWKRRAWRDAWRDGDTCNLAIGQGALVATPLQMAGVAAALANGGFVHRPHLVRATRAPGEAAFRRAAPPPAVDLAWNPAWMRTVRDGMRDVVMDERGTGRRAAIPGVSVAGKTGTAEYGPKEEGRKRGWMLAFAPFEAPRYAVAMVVEEAESGGLTVAPRMRALLEGLFAAAPGPEGENG